ncbi:hypothetical protein MLD38_013261 [Melastoma candidum]|uniref:Uncharacterized protein n=1 Tax=Melastoma candidum TaxID=119954 RepID=A0ACB9RA46_9MYRT|nr:hypothetical protein MLD38_013261 [Melastoma candidum]
MHPCSLSYRVPHALISCHVSSPHVALRTTLPPPPPPPSSAPPPVSIAPTVGSSSPSTPSLSCALDCPHFHSCSGCVHEFDLHRPPVVRDAEEFFRGFGVSDFTFDSCRLWGWRCRAKLAVRGTSGNPLVGLYEEGTHNVVDIPECKAHHPNINAAVELLKKGIRQLDIEPHDEDQGTGELRYVQMAVTTHNTSLPLSERYQHGRVQVALVWNSRNESSPGSEKLFALAHFLWRNGGSKGNVPLIHSVWANFQTSTNNIIFGHRWRHLLGERDFWEHVGGIDVSLVPSGFGQANTRAFDTLLRKLQKYVPHGASVTDLYAGAGVIGLSLAATRKCRSIRCVEINMESKFSFEKTLERLPKSVDGSISWHHADATTEPSSWMVGSDVIVVDPPRKGLGASVVTALESISSKEKHARSSHASGPSNAKEERRPWVLRAREPAVHFGSNPSQEDNQSLPQTLIYISCGWESFKEDCKSLVARSDWRLHKVHGFNFFPGTDSIEVLAVFKRGRQSSSQTGKKKPGKKKSKKQP